MLIHTTKLLTIKVSQFILLPATNENCCFLTLLPSHGIRIFYFCQSDKWKIIPFPYPYSISSNVILPYFIRSFHNSILQMVIPHRKDEQLAVVTPNVSGQGQMLNTPILHCATEKFKGWLKKFKRIGGFKHSLKDTWYVKKRRSFPTSAKRSP